METSPFQYLWNTQSALEQEQFQSVVTKTKNFLRDRAASGNSVRKFAAANTTAPSNQTIHGLVQCTPDLSENDCRACLNAAISEIPKCCNGMKGGRVLGPSCNLRYESYVFFDVAAAQPFTSLSLSPPSSSPLPPLAPPISNKAEEDKDGIMTVESLQMDFETIKVATNDFSDANKLGQGGFGPVYLGRLGDGEEIAVKRLSRDSGQGEMEFKNEVLLVAKLQHRNLVRLLGFCLENKEKLLVYEFLPNKSLDCFIFDSVKRVKLNWEKRYKIIEGIARGLVYLHHDSRIRIVHRDLKASNVLLDEEMNTKISDFGMARLLWQIKLNPKQVQWLELMDTWHPNM
ncbi:hypothetical protein K1719_014292 [Acacia pycnantha]|nr:hypothetical protein K1719_014292 [Acacia pycnantha]